MEGVPLIPRFTNKESRDLKLEKYAEDWVFNKNSDIWSNNDNSAGDNYGSFNVGYNKAKEAYGFTREDVLKAIKFGESNDISQSNPDGIKTEDEIEEFINSIKIGAPPKYFIGEYWSIPCLDNIQGCLEPHFEFLYDFNEKGTVELIGTYEY